MNSKQAIKDIASELLHASPAIRYVAVYASGEVVTEKRGNVSNGSTAESDFYEEVLVNPTLLKLAQQRGNLDCGGLRFLVVAYGHFYQLITPTIDGHISVCIELTADLSREQIAIAEFLKNARMLG